MSGFLNGGSGGGGGGGGTAASTTYSDTVAPVLGATNVQTALDTVKTLESSFVFRPGGTAGGNVYTSESLLFAAVAACQGLRTIWFDLSLNSNAYTFTTAGALDHGLGVRWFTDNFETPNILTFSNNTTLTSFPVSIENFNIQITQGSYLYTTPADYINCITLLNTVISGKFLNLNNLGEIDIAMFGNSQLFGTNCITNDGSSVQNIYLNDGSVISPGVFDLSNSPSISVIINSSGVSIASQYSVYIDPNNVNNSAARALTGIQSGTSTLSSGVSPAISATITSSSVIIPAYKTRSGTTSGTLFCSTSDRTTGTPGSFKVRSLSTAGVANTTDASTFDWIIIG